LTNIRSHVRDYYRSLYAPSGHRPQASVPILTGKALARSLGYPLHLLDSIPKSLWRQFFPCGYPLSFLQPTPHDRILNLGSGVGVDALTIRLMHDFPLHVVNMDIVESVLHEGVATFPLIEKGGRHKTRTKTLVHWVCADGEHLPFADEVFHWVVLNGVLNLFSPKELLLQEILRVMIPGGGLTGADLCCADTVPGYFAEELDAWAWCMSGACSEAALGVVLSQCGFSAVALRPAENLDLFYRVTFSCRKPLAL
jgi:arsenite methyltransferase